jgi:hypothetical protein
MPSNKQPSYDKKTDKSIVEKENKSKPAFIEPGKHAN